MIYVLHTLLYYFYFSYIFPLFNNSKDYNNSLYKISIIIKDILDSYRIYLIYINIKGGFSVLNVLFYANYKDDYLDILKNNFQNINFTISKTKDELYSHLGNADVLVTTSCTKEMLEKAPNLKWIQSIRAGVDSYPIEEIKNRGIILTNGKGIHKVHMAEYAIAAMIILARNLHLLFRNQINEKWDRNYEQGEINDATVGIIGLGSIGREVAKKASLMGMRVLGVKSNKEVVAFVNKIYTPDQMDRVFKESDYIINLLPYTPETEEYIDKDFFNLMKPSASFINIGRGKTVNESDLIDALKNNRIKAFFSDVFYEEPLDPNSPLWNMENVVVTPHLCGESTKYMHKALEVIEHNLNVYINKDGDMINLVDLNRGY